MTGNNTNKPRIERYMDSFVNLYSKFIKKPPINKLDEEHQVMLFQIFMDSADTTPPPRRGKKK